MNILLLHGLFGSPANWHGTIKALDHDRTIYVPQLPIDPDHACPPKEFGGIEDLTQFVEDFVDYHKLHDFVIGGNSLGGQIAIDYTFKNQEKVAGLMLTGSAGLYERAINGQGAKVKKGRDAIAATAAEIFYDKTNCTEEIVDQAVAALEDKQYARFLVRVAKATRDYRVNHMLEHIHVPTLLVWGKQDVITPPEVAKQFEAGIHNADLRWIDECGHSPPLEQPEAFAAHIKEFIEGIRVWRGYF
jgi:pimeloyl-ACP methyl ester carboxylesterase